MTEQQSERTDPVEVVDPDPALVAAVRAVPPGQVDTVAVIEALTEDLEQTRQALAETDARVATLEAYADTFSRTVQRLENEVKKLEARMGGGRGVAG